MAGEGDSSGAQPAIGAAAKAAFLAALRDGARREDAAAAAGFTISAFYGARRRDPAFAAHWTQALAATPPGERRRRSHLPGETRIVPNNRRGLQRRRMRHVRFDEDRRAVFLAAFAWSCDAAAAAAEAGVSESTVYLHRRTDPAFAEEFQAALDQGYARLEAEALRQRLAAQDRLRAAVEESAAPGGAPPLEDMAAEFERVLKLLDRWDRRNRRPERHASPGSRRQAWTFDSAVTLLDRHLRSLGVEIPVLPPEIAARYDPPEPGEGAQ